MPAMTLWQMLSILLCLAYLSELVMGVDEHLWSVATCRHIAGLFAQELQVGPPRSRPSGYLTDTPPICQYDEDYRLASP